MVYAVQAQLYFTSAAIRDTKLTKFQNVIAARPRWEATVLEASGGPMPPAEGTPFGIIFDARFTSENDQKQTDLALKGEQGIQPGSWVQIHDCPHDEANPVLCVVESRTEM